MIGYNYGDPALEPPLGATSCFFLLPGMALMVVGLLVLAIGGLAYIAMSVAWFCCAFSECAFRVALCHWPCVLCKKMAAYTARQNMFSGHLCGGGREELEVTGEVASPN